MLCSYYCFVFFISHLLSVKQVEMEAEYKGIVGVSLSEVSINTRTLQHKLLGWGKVDPLSDHFSNVLISYCYP